MGQTESSEAAAGECESQTTTTTVPTHSNSSSMKSLIAEAAAYGSNDSQSLEEMAEKALECPCVADLKTGPCGVQFSEAFVCFLRSTQEEKGSDCVHPFIALQNCIKANPDAFSKDIIDGNEVKDQEPVEEYRIIPPTWAREPKTPKPKL